MRSVAPSSAGGVTLGDPTGPRCTTLYWDAGIGEDAAVLGKRIPWERELEALESELALHLASVRREPEQAIVWRSLLATLADLRALAYSRIAELEQPPESWNFGEDT
jgi:hypothetical protein